jgi:DNA (cytosine-5)-methyltransferase 1
MGFNARWGVLGAADVGAKHQRDRIWLVANSKSGSRWRKFGWSEFKTYSNKKRTIYPIFNQPEPLRVVNGVAARVDRLKAIGNGQVPLCAATAWRILSGGA